jgi:hypothetical protein
MRRIPLAAVLALACSSLPASAEKASMSPEALRRVATHVIVGEVRAIYERKSTEGEWRYGRFVAEVRVDSVEEGEGVAAGGLVYVRYWRREWVGPSSRTPTDTWGHRDLPKEGETLRIYLARNAYDGFATKNDDGGLNVIGANGFERPTPAPAPR